MSHLVSHKALSVALFGLAIAVAVQPAAANDVATAGPVGDSCPNACLNVSVDIDRTDTVQLRGFSVTISLVDLDLCNGLASIVEGTYLNAIGATAFQTLDNMDGTFTVDGVILGQPCGQDADLGTLFTVDVESTTGGTTSGTVTVTDVELRDCSNAAVGNTIGAASSLTFDVTPPATIGDLASTQITSGNDSDGTTAIQVDFTAPGDAALVEVFRAGFGDYPEYDDGTGTVPAAPTYPPAAPWTGTSVTAGGQTDEVTARDYYYYSVFTTDACGNVSALSNVTGGTLNYHLGDVTNGTPGMGDNLVTGLDVSALGGSYGAVLMPGDPVNYLDVGPTADGSVNTLPQTDNEVQFEDLIIFAINFGLVSVTPPTSSDVAAASRAGEPMLVLELTDDGTEVLGTLRLLGDATIVKGTSATIAFDASALRLENVHAGELVDGNVFMGKIHDTNAITIDAAVLGAGLTFSHGGVIAELRFTKLAEGAMPELTAAELRNPANQSVGSFVAIEPGTPDVSPARFVLGARPNPFRASTQIVLELPSSTTGSLRVYDVNGRLVSTLADGQFAAGSHVATWDGRATDGGRVAAGVYFYTFQGESQVVTKKLLRTE